MTPPLAVWGVGSNPKPLTQSLPQPWAKVLWSVVPYRLHWGHAKSVNWSWTGQQGRTVGTQTCERRTGSEWFSSSTDARVRVGFGGFVNNPRGTENFGGGWFSVLGDLLDGWSETSERVARHTTHDQVVFQLRHHRRTGTLVGVGCRASLVYQSERSDRDPSSSQADRSDGCSEHSLDEFAWFHTKRQSQIGLGRDKGCQ